MRNTYHIFRLVLKRNNSDFTCLVDDSDLSLIADYAWSVNAQGYAIGYSRTKNAILMHRLIMGASSDEQVDHINRDKLDNRKCNLRIVSHRTNMLNRPIRHDNKFGLRGVSSAGKKYRANITVNKKTYWLGSFDTPEQAAQAYNKAALKMNGQDAELN